MGSFRDNLNKRCQKTVLKKENARADRCNTPNFMQKEKAFQEVIKDPLVIHKQQPRLLLQHSGMVNWETDLKHLENQMKRTQEGTVLGVDVIQKKRDIAREKRLSQPERVNAKQKADLQTVPIQFSSTSSSQESDPSSQDEFANSPVPKKS